MLTITQAENRAFDLIRKAGFPVAVVRVECDDSNESVFEIAAFDKNAKRISFVAPKSAKRSVKIVFRAVVRGIAKLEQRLMVESAEMLSE